MSFVPTLPEYIFTEKLGKGSYATVYKAYRKGARREAVAIKCVLKSSLTKSSVENLITEISILKKIKHEHVVELKDFQWDATYIYLIMEFCSGGDLSHFIKLKKRLPESVAQRFLQQLAKALQFLRSQNIAHMDLKPQNILLSNTSNPILKLGDFGLAQYLHSDCEASALRGSPLYMAPEILLNHHYDARVDLWSVGIILYECLFGQAPFSSHTFAELAEKIKSSNPVQIPYGAEVSDKCRDLILRLLQRNTNKRLTFEEFFNHPFVDLEHMPSDETYAEGVSLVQQAVQADADGKYLKAIQFYGEALEYLIPHIHNQKDSVKRNELRKKLLDYVTRAEELKKLSENDTHPALVEEMKEPTLTLDKLLSEKPQLKKALYLAKQADVLVNDGCYDDASEIYKSALEIMVPAVSSESCGQKKEVLYAEVNKWMQKAEDLKTYLSIIKQQKHLDKLSFKEDIHYNPVTETIDSTCCIQ